MLYGFDSEITADSAHLPTQIVLVQFLAMAEYAKVNKQSGRSISTLTVLRGISLSVGWSSIIKATIG